MFNFLKKLYSDSGEISMNWNNTFCNIRSTSAYQFILTLFENSGHSDRRGGSKIVKMMLGGNAILGVAEMCVTGIQAEVTVSSG